MTSWHPVPAQVRLVYKWYLAVDVGLRNSALADAPEDGDASRGGDALVPSLRDRPVSEQARGNHIAIT